MHIEQKYFMLERKGKRLLDKALAGKYTYTTQHSNKIAGIRGNDDRPRF